jgi:hypothetical protein
MQVLVRVPRMVAVPADLVSCQQRCKSAAHGLHVLRSLEIELLALRWHPALDTVSLQD